MRRTLLFALALLALVPELPARSEMTEEQRATIADTVRQAAVRFLETYDSLEAGAFVALHSDDVRWGARGRFQSRADFAAGVRNWMVSLTDSTNTWDEMTVQVLAPDVAVVGGTASEIEVKRSGVTLEDSYAMTLVWARRDGEWRVVHAHSSHPSKPNTATVSVVEIPVTTSSRESRRLFEEGEYLLAVGRGHQARDRFRGAVVADPSFVYGYVKLSDFALSAAERQEALDRAAANLEGKSDGERLLVEMSRASLTNDSERALGLARELIQRYPTSASAWLALARLQQNRNENTAARASAQRALELDPRSAGATYLLADLYLYGEPRDLTKAEHFVRRFNETYPAEAQGYELLGDVIRGQGDLAAAFKAYTKATDRDPELAISQAKKGHIASFLGKTNEALRAYDAAIENARPETRALFANYRAYTYIHAGDVQRALDELAALAGSVEAMGTPADQVKGIRVFVLTNHATVALHAGKLTQAAESIAERNRLQREIASQIGTEDERRLRTSDIRIHEALLAAYRGDDEAALRAAEAAAKLVADDSNPRRLEPYYWVSGLVALRQGGYARAVERLRQADHANDVYVRFHLALAEEGAGNLEEATRLFREIAAWNFNSIGFALVRREAARLASR